jgi:hypothetical protein
LVNALILTIPFGVIMGLGFDYWDAVETVVTQCSNGSVTYPFGYSLLINTLYATAYSSMTSIAVSIFYYMLRPSDEEEDSADDKKDTTYTDGSRVYKETNTNSGEDPKRIFARWWRTGKYAVMVVFLGTVISVISMLTLFGSLPGWFSVASDNFCSNWAANQPRYTGAAFILIIFTLGSAILMV